MQTDNFDPETGEILDSPPVSPPAIQPPPAAAPPAAPRRRKAKKRSGNGRTPIPADETPRQRFVRIADGRVKAIIKSIRTLKKMGRNQAAYEYDQGDIDFMLERFTAELDELRAAWKPRENEGNVDFSFRRN